MPIFNYGPEEIAWLKSRDTKLGEVIAQIGPIQRQLTPDPFTGILRAITGQQVSGKAHAAIWKKFRTFYPKLSPKTILQGTTENLRDCGISLNKASTIMRIAQEFHSGSMKNILWQNLPDDSIANLLGAIKGIGPWTIEMVLIFTFQRKNILSYGDLAIRRGMSLLYSQPELSRNFFEEKKKIYSPFGTVAGFYLWEIAGGILTF